MACDRVRLRRGVAVAVAAGLLAVTGCADGGSPTDREGTQVVEGSGAAAKSGTGERRTDLEPLTKRFPALGAPASAVWMSGTFGDGSVPGPSTYWIDAVVTLADGEADALAEQYAAEPVGDPPDLVPDLDDDVPSGDLVGGDALDAAFSTSGFASRAWLSTATDELVLTSKGQ